MAADARPDAKIRGCVRWNNGASQIPVATGEGVRILGRTAGEWPDGDLTRRRLDAELVRRGLAASRARAAELVEAGDVLVSGTVATRVARLVDEAEPVEVRAEPMPYVSRGGLKLAHALDAFGIDVSNGRCLDVGASTGGFTDCLLQRGAREVVAVDVGRGQLDWALRNDPRVRVMERTDVRSLDPDALGPVDFVCADLAFISLRTVLPRLAALAGHAGMVLLVKPQFEVGRGRVGKGGVVRDPALHAEAVASVGAAAEAEGLQRLGLVSSPVRGADGNVEFLMYLRRSR